MAQKPQHGGTFIPKNRQNGRHAPGPEAPPFASMGASQSGGIHESQPGVYNTPYHPPPPPPGPTNFVGPPQHGNFSNSNISAGPGHLPGHVGTMNPTQQHPIAPVPYAQPYGQHAGYPQDSHVQHGTLNDGGINPKVRHTDLEMQYASEYSEKQQTHVTTSSVVAPTHTLSNRPIPRMRTHRLLAPLLYWVDIFEDDVRYRWLKAPRLVKPASRYPSEREYRLRDHMDRVIYRKEDDRYISSWDGKCKELIVQCVDELFYDRNGETWMRTRITNRTPWHLRVADWCIRDGANQSSGKWVVKYIASCLLLSLPVLFLGDTVGHKRWGGNYDPFFYRLHGYPEVSRNPNEDPNRWQPVAGDGFTKRLNPLDRIEERVLGPTMLCTESGEQFQLTVNNWDAELMGRPFPEYVFVAYTSAQFPDGNRPLLEILNELGARAARDAGVSYYWVSCSCLPDNETEIYRISDIVRAAKQVVVAIGPSPNARTPLAMLKEFGTRVWTFPEILLAPKEQNRIRIYSHGAKPMELTLMQFARDVWEDSLQSRQLIDHFHGNLQLSRLELAFVGVDCFYSRHLGVKYPGDKAYAMMGLLRLRPPINPGETAFQAFARMSLLGDNDSLIERLICIQPKDPNQPWHDFTDAYDAKPWEIYPRCQIAGVGHAGCNVDEEAKSQINDTVIVDGMKAAKVCWKAFDVVYTETRFSWKRWLVRHILAYAALCFWGGIALMGYGAPKTTSLSGYSISFGGNPSVLAAGAFFFVCGLISLGLGPKFIPIVYGGKMWNNQPWLFGVEGYVDIARLEGTLFGLNQGYLKWAPFGSPLSRHHMNEHGEIVGDDPMAFADVRERIQRERESHDPNRQRLFTLIDTNTMTATLFQATRPPLAFLLAGSEGGHQRAIGVSYDWKTNTLYRETVLRMETQVEDKMMRVPRVRLGLKRPRA